MARVTLEIVACWASFLCGFLLCAVVAAQKVRRAEEALDLDLAVLRRRHRVAAIRLAELLDQDEGRVM